MSNRGVSVDFMLNNVRMYFHLESVSDLFSTTTNRGCGIVAQLVN